MIINHKNAQTTDDQMFTEGVIYINSAQWLLAYQIFKHLISATKNPSGALFYNMAICHFFAKEYQKTISTLSEALQKTTTPSSLSNHSGNLPQPLLEEEYQNKAHIFALTETVFNLNSAIVKIRIRRLLVDASLKTENWQEVIRLAALPEMQKYKNVIEALAIAKNKIDS